MNKDPIIYLENITKTFGGAAAVDQVNLEIKRGSFTTLLGPSGCGKTTLMRLIAGFYEADTGSVMINGKRVNGLPPYKRNTPLVFQDYALFPHMTVAENIAYGLKLRGDIKSLMTQKTAKMMEMLGLNGYGDRFPRQLSGGQQQRVALARALVVDPEILLLDEPLSNLDAKLRVEVRAELRSLQKKTGVTALYVTHDQDEALSMSDRIVVMRKGRVEQIGSPKEIYYQPVNSFVASFVGTVNFLRCQVNRHEGAETELVTTTGSSIIVRGQDDRFPVGRNVYALVRPEAMRILSDGEESTEANRLTGRVKMSSFLGSRLRYWIDYSGKELIVDDMNPETEAGEGDAVQISIEPSKIHILPEEQMEGIQYG